MRRGGDFLLLQQGTISRQYLEQKEDKGEEKVRIVIEKGRRRKDERKKKVKSKMCGNRKIYR